MPEKHLHQKTIKFNDYELQYLDSRLSNGDSYSDTVRDALHLLISKEREDYMKLKSVFETFPDIQEHLE